MKLVRPEKETIRRPVQLDRLREQLGVQFLPGELSLEPVRPVVPVPAQVVGKGVWVEGYKETLSTAGQYLYPAQVTIEEFSSVLAGIELIVYNAVAPSQLEIYALVPAENRTGGITLLKLTEPIQVEGDVTVRIGHPSLYWLSGHVLPAGTTWQVAALLKSDGVAPAMITARLYAMPVYQ